MPEPVFEKVRLGSPFDIIIEVFLKSIDWILLDEIMLVDILVFEVLCP